MRVRFVSMVVLALCVLLAAATSSGMAQQAVTAGDENATPSIPQAKAPVTGLEDVAATPAPGTTPELPFLTPEPSWTSANPCRVTCPNGGSIDCTWSWAGDPTFCCWKNSTRCQSYYCSSGFLVMSKVC